MKIQSKGIYKPIFLSILIGQMVLLAASVFGQDQSSSRGDNRNPRRESVSVDTAPRSNGRGGPDVIISSDEDYKLAPTDVIRISIEDAPELSGNYRISKDGKIPMKFLGAMYVEGKTPDEVCTIITEGLRDRYLKDPKVYVSVEQYNSRTFFIQGSVKTPGVYVIEGQPSLFKLITIAGGLTENHGSMAYIIRETKVNAEKLEKARAGIDQGKDQVKITGGTAPAPLAQAVEEKNAGATGIEGESEYELITAQISGLYKGRFEQNVFIKPNDLVYIPRTDVFFVAGEVKQPGQFTLREGTTLRQAISLAQGTFFRSAADRATIFRQDPATGKLNEVPVDVAAVMAGKKPDVLIMPNDVIMIPNSKVKTISQALLQTFGPALIYTLPYR